MRRLTMVVMSFACLTCPATASAALPSVLTQGVRHPFAVRPASIGYTGDGTGFLGGSDGSGPRHPGHLHWSTYTQHEGIATGVDWLDDCDPSCAGGDFHPVSVRVRVFRTGSGHFTRLLLRYRYNGENIVDRRGIRYVGGDPGYWTYYIIASR
ncbi:MAG TPA: hypothetical protein VN635_02695 [Conexibacter sp.]|nr:hypothetical protein [Conexibacter sp.]